MPTSQLPRVLNSLNDPAAAVINQAGSRAVIYDQNGKAALYEMRFSPDMCDLAEIQSQKYFPAGMTELKMAWRILDGVSTEDQQQYYVIRHDVTGLGRKTLGLIGFHIAIVTEAHPEMIWITVEQNRNNPRCNEKVDGEDVESWSKQWSFTSKECAQVINNQKPDVNCDFNKSINKDTPGVDITTAPIVDGEPTEVCQVYANGDLPGQAKEEASKAVYRC